MCRRLSRCQQCRGLQEPGVYRVPQAYRDLPALKAPVVNPARQARRVPSGNPAFLESQGPWGNRVRMDPRDRLDLKDPRDRGAHVDRLGLGDCPASRDIRAGMVQLGVRVMQGRRD